MNASLFPQILYANLLQGCCQGNKSDRGLPWAACDASKRSGNMKLLQTLWLKRFIGMMSFHSSSTTWQQSMALPLPAFSPRSNMHCVIIWKRSGNEAVDYCNGEMTLQSHALPSHGQRPVASHCQGLQQGFSLSFEIVVICSEPFRWLGRFG